MSGGRRCLRRAAHLLLAVVLLAAPPRAAAQEPPGASPAAAGEAALFSLGPVEYRPGRGARFGDTGLVLGGFTSIKAETTQADGGEFTLDLLNVFLIYDGIPRFRAVAELQLKDIFVASEAITGAQDFAFDVRRLFGDYSIADELNVRAGTFLTPIGYWNLILAPPLTWTTEVPLIIEETFFQETTTGVMLHGATPLAQGQIGYSLFSQFLDPLEDDPDLVPPDLTGGIRLAYAEGLEWSVGGDYQAAETGGRWSHLVGVFGQGQLSRVELLGELMFQDGDALPSSQWGTYLQAAVEVWGPLYAVGRYEHFDQPVPSPTLEVFTLGGVYKPFPFMAVKMEYRFAAGTTADDDPRGFFASFTTFF